jgi:hypothetical protein
LFYQKAIYGVPIFTGGYYVPGSAQGGGAAQDHKGRFILLRIERFFINRILLFVLVLVWAGAKVMLSCFFFIIQLKAT